MVGVPFWYTATKSDIVLSFKTDYISHHLFQSRIHFYGFTEYSECSVIRLFLHAEYRYPGVRAA